MEKNFSEFSMEDVKKLAQSDTGRQLMAMLSARGSEMDAAMASARQGDMEAAKHALSAFMADPQTQALLKKLRVMLGG